MPQEGSVALDNLKTLRLAAVMGLEDLARASATSDNTVKQLEDGGTASEQVAQRIADALAASHEDAGWRVF